MVRTGLIPDHKEINGDEQRLNLQINNGERGLLMRDIFETGAARLRADGTNSQQAHEGDDVNGNARGE
jgi:hypothetical protein